jgi:hypothetical protein
LDRISKTLEGTMNITVARIYTVVNRDGKSTSKFDPVRTYPNPSAKIKQTRLMSSNAMAE